MEREGNRIFVGRRGWGARDFGGLAMVRSLTMGSAIATQLESTGAGAAMPAFYNEICYTGSAMRGPADFSFKQLILL